MHTTIVYVNVKPECVVDFIKASQVNHEASIQESGNRRFDLLHNPNDQSQFILYEAYASAEDAAAHKQTEHYLSWRETVADMMAEPRRGISYNGLFPAQ